MEDEIREEDFFQEVHDGSVEGVWGSAEKEFWVLEFHVNEEAFDGSVGIVDREMELDPTHH